MSSTNDVWINGGGMISQPVLKMTMQIIAATLLLVICDAARGQNQNAGTGPISTVESLTEDLLSSSPIVISGTFDETLSVDTTHVHLITGNVKAVQGDLTASAARMAIFVTPVESGFDLAVYGEDVTIGSRHFSVRAFRLQTLKDPQFNVRSATEADTRDQPLLRRASMLLFQSDAGEASPVSFQTAGQDSFGPPIPSITPSAAVQNSRRVQIRPRSNDPLRFESFRSTDTVPAERINVITGGVNVLVEGVELDIQGQQISPGVIDLSADRVVIWTQAGEGDALEAGDLVVQSADSRFEVYMEGNIVIRQNQNVINATHAFYDAANNRCLLLNAELRAFIPTTGGYFRVRAERMRQLTRDRFHAQNAWATTSPYGRQGYRIQASDIFVEPHSFIKTDPISGQQVIDQSTWVTSVNNQFVAGDVPVFYLPKISGPAEDPGIPIRRATVTQDSIFGLQFETVWDMNRLLGRPKVPGLQWDLLADYRTKRGPGIGTQADYKGSNSLGNFNGNGLLYYQYDTGQDRLGRDRLSLEPPSTSRGEALLRHRQQLPNDAMVFGEIGYLSDRNYLEQFNESAFDTDKDVETLLGIRQDYGAYSGSLWGRGDLNGFEATTQWLPRADLYSFSQPLFDGLLYWNMHSSLGYADSKAAGDPTDPNEVLTGNFSSLGLNSYETDASGVVAMSRHELDAPFNLGPVNFEPFVMGEAAYWGEGTTGATVDRYLVSGGLRARMTATKIMPFIQSRILNLNGLAHKHDTMLEYSLTSSTAGINEINQYNEIDEDSQERFRTRYPRQIFGGVIPTEFNPRNYAIRTGAGLWTSAPYHELADDLQALRIGFRDRLQTKVGPAEAPRIRDWMVWEYGASFFPDADRDNFGEDFGLLYSHYRWNVSDRTSFLTDASWDLFDRAQNIWSVGVLSQRSLRGSVYLGFREVTATNGAAADFLKSQTIIGSYSYQMSPKWISTASCAYDVAASETRGTSLTVSRVSPDWVLHFGLGFDFGKDNVGVGISLEPRFGPPTATNLSYLLGISPY
ncbi:MAG: hypothetical protein ACK58L_06095 [Planctomycetota bacterium]